jgi:hypothetical protein
VNIYKIAGIIGILIALVAAFVNVPYGVELMTIAGIIVGISIIAEQHVRVIVSALALPALAASFNALPSVGPYITSILGNIGYVVGGAALLIILRNIYNRLVT